MPVEWTLLLNNLPARVVRIADVLARLLATAPDEAVREGAAALEIALEVFEDYRRPEFAETLAMALAEVGRFEEAVQVQSRVVTEIESRGDTSQLAKARRWLENYEAGRPVRAPWSQ